LVLRGRVFSGHARAAANHKNEVDEARESHRPPKYCMQRMAGRLTAIISEAALAGRR